MLLLLLLKQLGKVTAKARKKGGQLGKGSLKSFKYPSFFVFSPVFRVQSSFSLSLCSALVATDMQSI
jgi:hypothetical protein